MNEQCGREINIKWLIYRVLRGWKRVFLIALSIAIFAGCIKVAVNVSCRPNQSELEKLDADYIKQVSFWEERVAQLNTELQKLEDMHMEQLKYIQDSVRMKINPLRVHNFSVQIYVNYDYQILADLNLQDIDLSNHVLKAYSTYMTNGEMYHYIIDNLDYKLEVRNLTELLTMNIDYDNNMIYVLVKHYDPVAGHELLRLAQEAIILKSNEFNSSIGAHQLVVTTASSYESVDSELEAVQKEKQSLLIKLEKEIEEQNQILQSTSKPTPPLSYTLQWVITDSVKLFVIIFIASIVVIILLFILILVFSEKLLNPLDIKTRYNLRIIAQLPTSRVKTPFAFIDSWIAALGGIKTVPEDYDNFVKMAGINIRATLAANEETKSWSTIAFTSTIDMPDLSSILDNINLEKNYSLVFAPNILTCTDSMEKVACADCVVVTERQEETVFSEMDKELEVLKAWGKPVLGAIIFNTDARM